MADNALDSVTAAPKDLLASLAGQLQHAGTGTMARLRRSDPTKDAQSALFDSERVLIAAGVTAQGADRQRWALLLHCLALVQGRHDKRADAEPGKALQRLRFSEARLQQLVEADYPMLCALMPRLARRLAAAGVTVNWAPLASLLLHAGSNDSRREQLAEDARQRLVRHYLMAESLAAAETPSSDDDS